ncbi:poly-gamma-glutamate synthesis protein (capsule biosynthesis protein) [Marinobacter daqiaonensis]|uniref:Poly-gamma-glutamate synthesis protein (Capsule biosynthesis protein) n=1 Tax=Marinobacter daqiaonensis TaxID=650891 RepID=A0A1I6HVY4_9GAMM|nr:CapA family protein [Marinobacter daqiaonensis]SFR58587.1 poly-gamma-glutamate synthesis protein (capsule biosynthesis protein) [Marinobacter daqiaonensis]
MRIMFVGDINLGEYYTSFGHGPGTYLEHSDVFARVRELFGQADLVVGNLEAPLTTHNFDPDDPERVVLRGHPKHAKLLSEVGFSVLQVANNHTVQHGREGFDETVRALTEAGVEAVGLNQQELTVLEVGGKTLGFLAASDVPDNTDKRQVSYQRLDTEFLERVKASVPNVDHLFVMLHWGLESSTVPMDYQRELISELSQAGVRGIIGSHPHLFYEVWQEGETVCAPSLGNFVFDLCWDQRLLKTGILDVQLENEPVTAQVHPVTIERNGCLPTPVHAPVAVSPEARLYDLGDDMAGEQVRKLKYFFANLLKGDTSLKAKFFMRKMLPFTRPAVVVHSHG